MVLYAGPEATVPPAELELMKGGKSYHTTSRPKLIEKEDCAGLRYLCPASAEEDDCAGLRYLCPASAEEDDHAGLAVSQSRK